MTDREQKDEQQKVVLATTQIQSAIAAIDRSVKSLREGRADKFADDVEKIREQLVNMRDEISTYLCGDTPDSGGS